MGLWGEMWGWGVVMGLRVSYGVSGGAEVGLWGWGLLWGEMWG